MGGKLDHLAGQQLEGPTGAARWWARARGRDQQSFLLCGKLAFRTRTRLFAERLLQIAFDEAPLRPVDGRAAHPDVQGNLLIANASVRRQQDLRPLELARRLFASAQQHR